MHVASKWNKAGRHGIAKHQTSSKHMAALLQLMPITTDTVKHISRMTNRTVTYEELSADNVIRTLAATHQYHCPSHLTETSETNFTLQSK